MGWAAVVVGLVCLAFVQDIDGRKRRRVGAAARYSFGAAQAEAES